MSEARLYSYSEFAKTKRPDVLMLSAITGSNLVIRQDCLAYGEYWKDHLNKSQAAIQVAANRSGTDKGIVYGPGNCIDIPLSYLAGRFSHLTLVDIEAEGVTQAVERLRGSQQAKIDIQIEDIADIVAETKESLATILSRSTNPDDFAKRVLEMVPSLRPKTVDFGEDYDFVCSNLLGSQLSANLGLTFAMLGNARFPFAGLNEDVLPMMALRINRPDITNGFVFDLQKQHIDLLLGSAKRPGGVIYFADTFDVSYLRRDPISKQPYFIDERGRPVKEPSKLPLIAFSQETLEKLDERATIEEVREWAWYRKPPFGSAVGRAFGVKSITFLTK